MVFPLFVVQHQMRLLVIVGVPNSLRISCICARKCSLSGLQRRKYVPLSTVRFYRYCHNLTLYARLLKSHILQLFINSICVRTAHSYGLDVDRNNLDSF